MLRKDWSGPASILVPSIIYTRETLSEHIVFFSNYFSFSFMSVWYIIIFSLPGKCIIALFISLWEKWRYCSLCCLIWVPKFYIFFLSFFAASRCCFYIFQTHVSRSEFVVTLTPINTRMPTQPSLASSKTELINS